MRFFASLRMTAVIFRTPSFNREEGKK